MPTTSLPFFPLPPPRPSLATSRSVASADGRAGFSPFPHTGPPARGAAVIDADADAGLELVGNGSGTPNMTNNVAAAVSPGTWSPQWGWYVTMTPPQVSLDGVIFLFFCDSFPRNILLITTVLLSLLLRFITTVVLSSILSW